MTLSDALPAHPGRCDSRAQEIAAGPFFQAAKACGKLGLLSRQAVRAWSEADWLMV